MTAKTRKKMLRPCSLVPSADDFEEFLDKEEEEQEGLNPIAQLFSLETFVAKGSNGLVYATLVSRETGQGQAVFKITKMTTLRDLIEIRISCQLEELGSATHAFLHSLGWNFALTLPNRPDWNAVASSFPRGEALGYFFQIFEKAPFKLSEMKFTSDSDLVKTTLILLHGLHTANLLLGFEHRDLSNEGNYVFATHPADEDIVLRFDSFEVVISDLWFFPKLIDFGTSGTTANPRRSAAQKTIQDDYKNVLDVFGKRARAPQTFDQMKRRDWMQVVREDLRVEGVLVVPLKRRKDEHSTPVCFSCHSRQLRYQYEATPLQVCSIACSEKIRDLARVMRK